MRHKFLLTCIFIVFALGVVWGQEPTTTTINIDDLAVNETVEITDDGCYIFTGGYNPNFLTGSKSLISVAAGCSPTIVLEDVAIGLPMPNQCPLDLQNASEVTLILRGKNTLSAAETPAIWVGAGCNLLIKEEEGSKGILKADGGTFGAGIGGGHFGYVGNITITGGTITAIGGIAAGIGAGTDGAGGNITITGGNITAIGGVDNAAGIGDGPNSQESGTFKATGNAFINASSISDQSDKANWSGIIFEGDEGKVYGAPFTLAFDAEIPAGKTLTNDGELIIADGVTLTNNGTFQNGGTITGTGTLTPADKIKHRVTYNPNYPEATPTIKYTEQGADFDITPITRNYYTFKGWYDQAEGGNEVTDSETITAPIEVFAHWEMIVTVIDLDLQTGFVDGSYEIGDDGYYRVINEYRGVLADDKAVISVAADCSPTIVLDNATIRLHGLYQSPLNQGRASEVTLILKGENSLIAGQEASGIWVGDDRKLLIKEEEGSKGILNATGGANAAGIGGVGGRGDTGDITITGGTITAIGGVSAAGIGGGLVGHGGNIIISGGNITAIGGENATGIGGGLNGQSGTFKATGNAFIIASSISDQSDKANWSGIIFEGDNGKVYGDPFTLASDAEIPAGKTLTNDGVLTIADGVTLTINGTFQNGGTITGTGTLTPANKIEHRVTYNPNYHGAPPAEEIYIPQGNAFQHRTITRNSYTFTGWFDGEDVEVTDQKTITEPLMVYAKWKSNPLPPTPEPEPTVFYTVTLPAVEGAKTDPIPGDHTVEAWNSFHFYLTLSADYDQSTPIVTTSRNEVITPRASDGAYILKYIRTDVEIFIEGIVANDPVANEAIHNPDALKLWTEPSAVCLENVAAGERVCIISAAGRIVHVFTSVPGVNRREVSPGVYIVKVGERVRKVVVR